MNKRTKKLRLKNEKKLRQFKYGKYKLLNKPDINGEVKHSQLRRRF